MGRKKKFLKVFDVRFWYVAHIFLLIVWTLVVGGLVAKWIGIYNFLLSGGLFSTIVLLFWLSLFAYIFDTSFHSISKVD